MPTYVGQCSKCTNEEGEPTTYEYTQPMDNREDCGECPLCGAEAKKIINGVGMVKLYGVGLYKRTLKDTGNFA